MNAEIARMLTDAKPQSNSLDEYICTEIFYTAKQGYDHISFRFSGNELREYRLLCDDLKKKGFAVDIREHGFGFEYQLIISW